MGIVPGLKDAFIVLQVLSALGISMYAGAYICEVGREKDRTDSWRWVLAHTNPCGCHKIVMGGMNTKTPIRPYEPKYVDKPLISEDIAGIRKHYKLDCKAHWGGFGEWNPCSMTCGNGSQTRETQCVIPEVTNTKCEGTPATESRPCNNGQCPTWGAWGNWTECSQSCDNGTQYRQKECNRYNHQTAKCNGTQPEEHRNCSAGQCPNWGAWGNWIDCSQSCDNGTQYRQKECNRYDHPTAECNGTQPEEFRNCSAGRCPLWGVWSSWSDCSESDMNYNDDVNCGIGTRHRYRVCNNSSAFPDVPCSGQSDEHQCCESWDDYYSWRTLNGSFYYLVNESKTYDEARDACTEKNAVLTSIRSQEEQDLINHFLEDLHVASDVWIGLNDKQQEDTWTWEDGTKFNYTYWAPSEPNDAGNNEDCAQLLPQKWNDRGCHTSLPMYICKVDIVRQVGRPLGIGNWSVPNDRINASSFHIRTNTNPHDPLGPWKGRLNLPDAQWTPDHTDKSPWIQVNFPSSVKMTALQTQGAGILSFHSWVKEMVVLTGDTDDSLSVIVHRFSTNSDRTSISTIIFPRPVCASIVRIEPKTWNAHCALRFEVLGYQQC